MSQAIQNKLASLTPAQRAALEKKLAERRGESASHHGIPKRGDQAGPAPLSFAQERLWVLEQLERTSAYAGPRAMRLHGPLDRAALQQALETLTARHESLRTVFPLLDGRPYQHVLPPGDVPLTYEDLSTQPPTPEALHALLLASADAPFDLVAGPLFRVDLFRLGRDEHVLLLNFHHIISDEWSNNLFISEMNHLYRAYRSGETPHLPTPTHTYRDFAAWQRAHLHAESPRVQWWRTHLHETPHYLAMPLDRTRGPRRSFRGGAHFFTFDHTFHQRLAPVLNVHRATPFMFFLAVWQILLYRYSRQPRFCIGTPVGGRGPKELEALIGCFLNMIPLRADLSDAPTFARLLDRVRADAMDALGAADLPLEALLEHLQVERLPGITPLFQTVFSYHNTKHRATDLQGLRIEPVTLERDVAKFDLALHVMEQDGTYRAALEYNSDIYRADTIAAMAEIYTYLVETVPHTPERNVDALDLFTETRRADLLRIGCGAPAAPARMAHEGLLYQASQRPDAPAVVCGRHRINYDVLARRATQLAHYLLAQGAQPGMHIGVCLSREADLIVALTAVMMTGAAYVPMDPVYPSERLTYLLEDAGIFLLVTHTRLLENLDGFFGLPICMDSDADLIRSAPQVRLPRVDKAQVAYVVYTSASTGRAKGVQVSHAALANLIGWHTTVYPLGPEDRTTLIAGVGFDASVWEIWPTLTTGACLCIPDEDTRHTPTALAAYMDHHGVTVSFLPTPLAEVFVRSHPQPGRLKLLLTGGDRLQAYPGALPYRLINHYGPTENAVVATAGTVTPVQEPPTPPIGRPIHGTSVAVLDERLHPVPRGVPGELCIAGASLAVGYHGRAALTAEKFVPHPFAEEPGARLYRSGDMVRYTADHNLDFLGRTDHQIKLRGFRIEPDEIETVLVGHPQVLNAVVRLVGEARTAALVAWVQPTDDAVRPDATTLRDWAAAHLPEYMIPGRWMVLDHLPVNANGKIDRGALPLPEPALEVPHRYQAPRNEREAVLAEIWAEVLGRDQIGVFDNFFEIGGDSILSIQIVARAVARGLNLQSRHMFDFQTIAELAPHAGSAETRAAGREIDHTPFPLSPIQSWFFTHTPPQPNAYTQSMLYRLGRPVTEHALHAALKQLTADHDGLRTAFDWSARTARYLPFTGRDVLQLIDLRGTTGLARDGQLAQALSALHEALDLEAGNVFAAALIYDDAELPLLYMTAHHLVVDGVSWRILTDDLTQLLSREDKLGLPPKTTAFQHWSKCLQAAASEPAFAADGAYWRALADSPHQGLPAWFTQEHGHAEHIRVLDAEDTRMLQTAPASAFGMRLDEVLLAALAQALGRWCGGNGFRVDLESHGRREAICDLDLSRTVGWFTAVYPVLLHHHDDLETALVTTKEHLRGVPMGGIGYGMAAYILGDVAASRSEIAFNYHGVLDGLSSRDGLLMPAREPAVEARKRQIAHHWPLELTAGIFEGRLRIYLTYEAGRFPDGEITILMDHLEAQLSRIIRFCKARPVGIYTPSDFPHAGLDADQLKRLVDKSREVVAIYPCTPLQEGMLFHCLSEPASGYYVTQYQYTVTGDLDPERFGKSWRRVVSRHDVLRTAFLWEDLDRPRQVVLKDAHPPVHVEDWRDRTPAARLEALAARAHTTRQAGFQLDRAPLMNLHLLRFADREWHLIWNLHHSILDAWSIPLLLDDLLAAYKGRDLAPGRAYGAFMAWLATRNREEAAAFWAEQLSGFQGPTPLPLAYIRQESAGRSLEDQAVRQVVLNSEVTAAIVTYARTAKVTVNTLCQGTWALLLSRHAERTDVLFGATSSGRPADLPGVEETAGLFLNTVPLRAHVDINAHPTRWLAGLQKNQGAVRAFDYCAPAEIRAWAKIPSASLFESILVFENAPSAKADAQPSDAPFRLVPKSGVERTNFPLTLIAVLTDDSLLVKMDYHRGYFHDDAVARLLGEFERTLKALAAEPATLGEIDPVSEADRAAALAVWSHARHDCPVGDTLCGLFQQRVLETPDAVALRCEGTALTYDALNRQANRLAHGLRARGVVPDTVVGLCMQRSHALMIGLLGILKAGGAYLPVDPHYPRDRQAYMLTDSGAELLVTAAGWGGDLEATHIDLDTLNADGEALPDTDPEPVAGPHSAAYLIYTSGSTGRPKGALMTHHNVVRLRDATAQWYGFGPHDVWPLFHSYAFDVSVWEMWGALLNGGRLVLPTFAQTRSPEDFYRLCADEGVTVLNQTPSAFYPLAEVICGREEPWTPNWVIFAGEFLDVARLKPWFDRFGDQRTTLVNMYGTTETCVHATYRVVSPTDIGGVTANGVGEPIPDLDILILDTQGRPAPLGSPGEIHIGGPGLARGYHGREALTRERFIAHPLRPGARLYKTGDWGRISFSGELEYLGRKDHQVKIRGFRVELGEIEAALRQHPDIDTAVVGTDLRDGHKRLVAWFHGAPTLAIKDIRTHLTVSLPDYMIPALWVRLEAVPLTDNGKVDRGALPAPHEDGGAADDAGAPRSEAEIVLCDIWRDVLGLETLGIHDNFFELGGDSILSIRIVARAVAAGLYLNTQDLFDYPTVAQSAARAQQVRKYPARQDEVVDVAPLGPIQHWFFSQGLTHAHHFNLSRLFQVTVPLNETLLRTCLQRLLSHHDSLRAVFPRTPDAARRQVFGPVPDTVPLETVPLDGPDWALALDRAANAAQASLDPIQGPMIKLVWFPMSTRRDRLLLVVHHLVSDIVSLTILVEDLSRIIEALTHRKPPRLPDKTSDAATVARYVTDLARAPETLAEAAYWTEGGPCAPPPFDGPGPSISGNTRLVSLVLEAETTRTLLRAALDAWKLSALEVQLVALTLAWHAWTGGPLDVDLEGHGRTLPDEGLDLTRTVGWFTALYPFRPRPATGDPLDVLKTVKEAYHGLPRHGLGYGLLRYLGGQEAERLRSTATSWVRFNYLGVVDGAAAAHGVLLPDDGPRGMEMNPTEHETYALRLDSRRQAGRLILDLKYSPAQFEPETIDGLVRHIRTSFDQVAACCAQGGGLTPSDVPLARLDRHALDGLPFDPAEVEDIHPLSPLQEGMLFHAMASPEKGVYVNQSVLRLPMQLDPQCFQAAWDDVFATHGILRTRVWHRPDQPTLLVVHKKATTVILVKDLHATSDAEAVVAHYQEEAPSQPFAFDEGPPMRMILFRMPDATWRFVWTYHHILLDAWSMPLIFGRLTQAYEAVSRGTTPLPLKCRPYGDYIRYLARRDGRDAADWWRTRLAGFTTPTPLPLVFERPADQGDIHKLVHTLPADTTATLTATAKSLQVTLNTILQAAWGLLLGRYAGLDDVVFGTTTAGRPADLPGVETMVGLFINTQPLRLRLSDDTTPGELLRELQHDMNRQRRFEHEALTDIRRHAALPPGETLFHSLLVFENAPTVRGGTSDTALPMHFERGFQKSHFPLALVVVPGKHLALQLEYGDGYYDAARIHRLACRMVHLLTHLPACLDHPLSAFSFADTEEAARALHTWNRTERDFPARIPIHRLFEVQAARHPEAEALLTSGQSTTYAQLNTHANQLAHHLRGVGLMPGDLAAVALPRGTDLIVSMVAVLKCGAAYVPLDPEHPPRRNRLILEDAQPRLVLDDTATFADLLPVVRPVYVGPCTNLEDTDREDALAYVMYTSGTTGRPKGVVIGHTAVNRLVCNTDYLQIAPHDRVVQAANTAFDAATFEIWGALLNGATLLSVAHRHLLDMQVFAAFLKETGATILFQTTALFNRMAAEHPEGYAGLRCLLFGGQLVQPKWVARILASGFSGRLLHVYGPTETTTFATWHLVTNLDDADTVPIGTPLANTTVYLLTPHGRPVPPGAVGEVFIGGPGLAQGYFGQPELTAQKFLSRLGDVGERLYRTGDLARQLDDGSLVFLGRRDHQVKLRGFRIELGEIEAALHRIAGVDAAAVRILERTDGEQYLAAWFVGDTEPGVCRDILTDALPHYMVPTSWCRLTHWPLTPNGKIDYRALPRPTGGDDQGPQPCTGTEQTLATLWQEILEAAHVGREDNFFDLGGHSLLAARLQTRILSAFSVRISIADIFNNGRLADLAACIDGLPTAVQATPITRRARRGKRN